MKYRQCLSLVAVSPGCRFGPVRQLLEMAACGLNPSLRRKKSRGLKRDPQTSLHVAARRRLKSAVRHTQCINIGLYDKYFIHSYSRLLGGQDSVLGIATCYGLHGPGFEPRWELDFSYPSRSALGSTQLPVQLVAGHFPGGKAAGAWR